MLACATRPPPPSLLLSPSFSSFPTHARLLVCSDASAARPSAADGVSDGGGESFSIVAARCFFRRRVTQRLPLSLPTKKQPNWSASQSQYELQNQENQ